jgi:hypothetical protein
MTLFRCTASGLLPSGRSWSFRMHFNSGLSTGTVETDWNAQLLIAWSTGANPYKIFVPAATTLAQSKTERLQVVTHAGTPPVDKLIAVEVATALPAIVGTNANGALPDQNTVLVSLRSGLPGRSNRGRIHLPAPSVNLVTAGMLAPTDAAKVSARFNGLLTGMIAAGHNPVVVTYVVSKTGRTVGSIAPIIVAETDEVIRTERIRNKSEKAVYA